MDAPDLALCVCPPHAVGDTLMLFTWGALIIPSSHISIGYLGLCAIDLLAFYEARQPGHAMTCNHMKHVVPSAALWA